MVEYNCSLCNFNTRNKADYSRHEKSKKHAKNVAMGANKSASSTESHPIPPKMWSKSNLICDKCNSYFSRPDALKRHIKKCKQDNQESIEVIKLKLELEKYMTIVEKQTEDIEYYKDSLEYYKSLVKDAGIGTSITNNTQNLSVQGIIMSKHADAPALKKADPKILQVQFDSNDEHKNAQVILYYYRRNMIASFIGDGIVAAYKKDDPNEQSLWSTDVSRVTMIIKKLMDKEKNESSWIADKKGIKTREYIIDPLMNKVKDLIKTYIGTMNAKAAGIKDVYDKMTSNWEAVRLAIKLHDELDNNIYHDDILRYIAPRFSYSKE